MNDLNDSLEEELQQLDEKQEKNVKDKGFIKNTLDAADRRLQKSKGGSLAIIAGFLITLIASSTLSWFQEQRIITEEGVIIILLMFSAWLGFQAVYLVYNYFALRLQAKAVEIDKSEIENQQQQELIKLESIKQERRIARDDMAFLKEQNRKDRKLMQDMQIRLPFMERIQEETLSLFKREDLKAIIEVSPSFVETVRRLDEILMKDANTSMITEELTDKISQLCKSNQELYKQVKDNAEVLNQVIQQYAQIEVKSRATELKIERIQNEVTATGSCIDNLMELLRSGMPKDHPELTILPKTSMANEHVPSETNTYSSSQIDDYNTIITDSKPTIKPKKKKKKLPPPPEN